MILLRGLVASWRGDMTGIPAFSQRVYQLTRTIPRGDRISPSGGSISKRRLLSIEGGQPSAGKTLFDVLLFVAPPRPHP